MILTNEADNETVEPMAMVMVANNNPGQGAWYIACVAYRGFDEDSGTDLGMTGYDFRLGRWSGSNGIVGFSDEVDDPLELLGMIPAEYRDTMRQQCEDFMRDDLPKMLDDTIEWDEEYGEGEGPSW